jgi:hypothetical protein
MILSSEEETCIWDSWSIKEVKYIWESFIMYTIY